MIVHDSVLWLCAIATVGLVLAARDRLRMNEPKIRVALGAAGILLATLIFLGVMLLLPRPWENGLSSFTDSLALAASSAFGGLLVLSLIEIAGGVLQMIKRRRYHRKQVG